MPEPFDPLFASLANYGQQVAYSQLQRGAATPRTPLSALIDAALGQGQAQQPSASEQPQAKAPGSATPSVAGTGPQTPTNALDYFKPLPTQKGKRIAGFQPGDITSPASAGLPPEQQAFLNAIAAPESSFRYDVRYSPKGDQTFTDMTKHPAIFERTPTGQLSSAAGRYQFTKSTWDEMGGGDFSPQMQDKRAWELASRLYHRAYGGDLQAELQAHGFSPRVVRALASTWPSLRTKSGQARSVYNYSINKFGAQPAGEGKGAAPGPQSSSGEFQVAGDLLPFPPSNNPDVTHAPQTGIPMTPGGLTNARDLIKGGKLKFTPGGMQQMKQNLEQLAPGGQVPFAQNQPASPQEQQVAESPILAFASEHFDASHPELKAAMLTRGAQKLLAMPGEGGGGGPGPTGPSGPVTVKAPAIRWPNGKVTEGSVHADAYQKGLDAGMKAPARGAVEQGFTLSDGSFVSREEAMKIAVGQRQVPSSKMQYKSLTSDDLKPGSSDKYYGPGGPGGTKKNVLTDALGSWLGISAAPAAQEALPQAPQMSQFPSKAEARFAQQNENFRGTGFEHWTGGQQFNKATYDFEHPSMDERALWGPEAGKNVPGSQHTGDYYSRIALAANRNPIAALGFDPRAFNVTPDQPKALNTTAVGLYNQQADHGWANESSPTGMLHESIHRGLEFLRQNSPEANSIINSMPDEEYIVRWMMQKYAGNPEPGEAAKAAKVFGNKGVPIGQQQINRANMMFKHDPSLNKKLVKLIRIAQQIIGKRGGPR